MSYITFLGTLENWRASSNFFRKGGGAGFQMKYCDPSEFLESKHCVELLLSRRLTIIAFFPTLVILHTPLNFVDMTTKGPKSCTTCLVGLSLLTIMHVRLGLWNKSWTRWAMNGNLKHCSNIHHCEKFLFKGQKKVLMNDMNLGFLWQVKISKN